MSKLCAGLERTGSPCKDIAFRLSSARTPTCWLQTWRTYGKKIANPDRILTFGRLMEFSVSCLDHLGRGSVSVRRSSMAELISNQNKETS